MCETKSVDYLCNCQVKELRMELREKERAPSQIYFRFVLIYKPLCVMSSNVSDIPLIHCCWIKLGEVVARTARSLLVYGVCWLAVGRDRTRRSCPEQAEVGLSVGHGIGWWLELSCRRWGDRLVWTVVVFQVKRERTGWRASPVFIWRRMWWRKHSSEKKWVS